MANVNPLGVLPFRKVL